MSTNIFQQACLVQLSTSCWQGSKALESSVMETRFKGSESEWLRGRKCLVNPESLAPVKAAAGRGRTFLDKQALPFPIKGLTLVPKEMLTRIDSGLEEVKQEFQAEVEAFLDQYENERQKAKASLGDLFNEMDYPMDIDAKFRFEWRFLTLDVPGKANILPPEVYEREKAKFQAMMEETRDLAMSALREEFAGLIHHMLERLTGEQDGRPKVFKRSMMEKMQEFLESFDDRNLFQDEQLAELVSQARDAVANVSPEKLRENRRLRKRISNEMYQLQGAIDKAIEDLPRRKIRLAA